MRPRTETTGASTTAESSADGTEEWNPWREVSRRSLFSASKGLACVLWGGVMWRGAVGFLLVSAASAQVDLQAF